MKYFWNIVDYQGNYVSYRFRHDMGCLLLTEHRSVISQSSSLYLRSQAIINSSDKLSSVQ